MPDVTDVAHRLKAGVVRQWRAALRDSEDLVSVGAYVPGTNPGLDAALERRDAIDAFLCQRSDTCGGFSDAIAALEAL
jgi:flagellar biosynthesis/type III secretory pathway ATPase